MKKLHTICRRAQEPVALSVMKKPALLIVVIDFSQMHFRDSMFQRFALSIQLLTQAIFDLDQMNWAYRITSTFSSDREDKSIAVRLAKYEQDRFYERSLLGLYEKWWRHVCMWAHILQRSRSRMGVSFTNEIQSPFFSKYLLSVADCHYHKYFIGENTHMIMIECLWSVQWRRPYRFVSNIEHISAT